MEKEKAAISASKMAITLYVVMILIGSYLTIKLLILQSWLAALVCFVPTAIWFWVLATVIYPYAKEIWNAAPDTHHRTWHVYGGKK